MNPTPARGEVQRAIYSRVWEGQRLATPARGASFTVARIDDKGVVLLLGEHQAWTPLSWACLEGVLSFLSGRDWVVIGGRYDTSSEPGTLDGYLKGHLKRATAGWVAVLLEHAGLVELDRGRPGRIRLCR